MAIEYREHIDADGVHREWTNEYGIVQRELMEPSEEWLSQPPPTWEQFEIRADRN